MAPPDEFHPEAHPEAKEITGPQQYGQWGQCIGESKQNDRRCHGHAMGPHGKCNSHGGGTPTAEENPKQGRGDQDKNQNAQTHALFSQHDGYYHDLDEDEQEWVFDFTHTLLDRHRNAHGKKPDMFDREALKNIAIDFHRIAHANGYFREKGLVQTDYQGTMEGRVPLGDEVNVWAGEIRQYNESIYRRMKKHGLLDDPDSQQADAMNNLAVEIGRTHVTEENVNEFTGD